MNCIILCHLEPEKFETWLTNLRLVLLLVFRVAVVFRVATRRRHHLEGKQPKVCNFLSCSKRQTDGVNALNAIRGSTPGIGETGRTAGAHPTIHVGSAQPARAGIAMIALSKVLPRSFFECHCCDGKKSRCVLKGTSKGFRQGTKYSKQKLRHVWDFFGKWDQQLESKRQDMSGGPWARWEHPNWPNVWSIRSGNQRSSDASLEASEMINLKLLTKKLFLTHRN